MLVKNRYKVIRVLEARDNYAFAEAVDLLDREKHTCLLNIYEGPLLREYLADFDRMDACSAFAELFVEGNSLVSVFTPAVGRPIDECFYRGDQHPWRERLYYAGLLLEQALELADLPAAVSCAAMLSENVRIDPMGERVCLRFQVTPMAGMDERELAWLTVDQLKKILRPQASSPAELLEFLDELELWSGYANVVQLYRVWRQWYEPLGSAYEALEKMNFFQRWLHLGWTRFRRRRRRGRS